VRTSSRTPSRVPDRPREQALHAVGTGVFGVLGDLPPIFPLDLAEEGLQGEQSVLTWLGASEGGSQALMQMAQGQGPATNLIQGWPDWLGYGRLMVLHAFLVSDRRLEQEVSVLREGHISA
jgi:hypothetical protein